MSRCFPFPPPGYEKKARTEDVDLLKKEKQREKKHKKEKRDKEKREGKEKREKEGGDGKHREKKDRKDKHRDKKKDREKEKDKEKDKNSTSDEKRFAGQSEGFKGENLNQKEKDKDKDKNSISDEKRSARQFEGYNGEKLSQNSFLAGATEDSKHLQELGRRIQDDIRGTANRLVEKFSRMDQKKEEGMVRLVAKDIGTCAEGKEKSKDKRVDDRKLDGQGVRDDARFSGNAVVQNLPRTLKNAVEGPVENIEKRMEGKEKTKEKEHDGKRWDKNRDTDQERRSQGKDKDREKEKKKEEKVKKKSEQRNSEQDKLKDSNKNDLIGAHDIHSSQLPPKGSDNSAAAEGKFRKRKELETNGFLHDNDLRPNKLPRPTSFSQLTENGTKLEPSQTSVLSASDRQGSTNNLKVDYKGHRINGMIEAPSSSIPATKPSLAPAQADQIAETSVKSPHPDSKYLIQVLSVPKVEERSDFDDQEWLFSSSDPESKKPKMETSAIDETWRVWAEALQIESADVCALPYVIPY